MRTATLKNIEDKCIIYNLYFYSNAKANHTLHFVIELKTNCGNPLLAIVNGVHIYIDVDDMGPIALSLIHQPSANTIYSEVQSLSINFIARVMRLCRHLMESYNPPGEPMLAQEVTDEQIVSDFANISFEFEAENVKHKTG